MVDARLQKIFEASSRLFINKGYEQTQIGHIVKETGISTGSIYDLFSGKKSIFEFILKCTIDPEFIHAKHELPINQQLFDHLEGEVISFFEKVIHEFTGPLTTQEKNYTYEAMLSDAFDLLSKYGTGCLLFEANPKVLSKLFKHYAEYRMRFYESITEYIGIFIKQNLFRPVERPEDCARYIVGSLYWWSMQIKYDIFESKEAIPEEQAKQICLDALLHAYGTEYHPSV